MEQTTGFRESRLSIGHKRPAVEDVDQGATRSKKHHTLPDDHHYATNMIFDQDSFKWDSGTGISYGAREGSAVHTGLLPLIDTSTSLPPNDSWSFDGTVRLNALLCRDARKLFPNTSSTDTRCFAWIYTARGRKFQTFSASPSNYENHSSSGTSSLDLGKTRYDACFGVIVTDVISSFVPQKGNCTTPVLLRPYGNIYKLYLEDSSKYAGILELPRLHNLLQGYAFAARGYLPATPVESRITKARKAKSHILSRQCSLRIIVYGLKCEKDAVSQFLSGAGVFLQQPLVSEWEPEPEYSDRPDTVTKSLGSARRTQLLGEVVALLMKEMGLGKPLSVLALICLSLDRLNDQDICMRKDTPRATLIVTPKSTIPGWLQQIKDMFAKINCDLQYITDQTASACPRLLRI
ncbi:uncharacterized protein Z519_06377 [Cladophialophora bantiana CBS 173.52]|uniref:SNF2 N-terminal domain-containing protein n=1 Tax=Cladophialophora bantiana (strain ATCC 10958 / CBS 173.52 / CDC B-1940 / NIH 8579) TaxID=1442370 RepID=A0A0D2HNZ7_CLAB1|nr:uncharacterized protein Z519_06377 [Cladophialophora bantiana CBS 173.52]KIW92530.1 hypothetical protein Z519_06377 [Cladophialophora bantiana CBS 173.52]